MHKIYTSAQDEPDLMGVFAKVPVLFLWLVYCLHITAHANSSWIWISETRPHDILPLAVVGTLAFETGVVILMARPKSKKKAFGIICLGNMLSFLIPYVLNLYDKFYGAYSGFNYEERYIVVGTFLVATLMIELPVEYFLLAKDVEKKKWLAIAVLIANIMSTGGVSLVERTLCKGYLFQV